MNERCFSELEKDIFLDILMIFREKVEDVFNRKCIEFWLEQKKEFFGW